TLDDTPIFNEMTGADANGNISLRSALTAANSSTDPNNEIDVSGVTGTMTLKSALPSITKNDDIIGPGSGSLTVQRDPMQGNFRIFLINPGSTTGIEGMTLKKGWAGDTDNNGDGGGILNKGSLTLYDVVVRECNAYRNGNGIANSGVLSMTGGAL